MDNEHVIPAYSADDIRCPRIIGVRCSGFDAIAWAATHEPIGKRHRLNQRDNLVVGSLSPEDKRTARLGHWSRLWFRNEMSVRMYNAGLINAKKLRACQCCKPAGFSMVAYTDIEYTCKHWLCPACHYRRVVSALRKTDGLWSSTGQKVLVMRLDFQMDVRQIENNGWDAKYRRERTGHVFKYIARAIRECGVRALKFEMFRPAQPHSLWSTHYLMRGNKEDEALRKLRQRVRRHVRRSWDFGVDFDVYTPSRARTAFLQAFSYPVEVDNVPIEHLVVLDRFRGPKFREYELVPHEKRCFQASKDRPSPKEKDVRKGTDPISRSD